GRPSRPERDLRGFPLARASPLHGRRGYETTGAMSAPPEAAPVATMAAFARGLKAAFTSVFVFVITVTYIGYGALVHDFGFSLPWAWLSTLLIWAAPAQVILVTAL